MHALARRLAPRENGRAPRSRDAHRGRPRSGSRSGHRLQSRRMPADNPRWTLISVLFSSIPLSPSLAGALHEAALDLYRRDDGVGQVAGDLVSGRVVNLRKVMQLGAISGPAFEARLETERGSGTVRYLLTRQGLELLGVPDEPSPRPRSRPALLN